ncbi:MAG TPA: tetratricopeptide repeat protein [Chthoniobacteraceae bacterium]|nr:tetratricopeptide repeat protein [Chthoniobacteraceae bacterium]
MASESAPPSRRTNWLKLTAALAVAAAMIAAYSNHFHNGFHFDDAHTIVNNGFIRDLRFIPRFFTDASTFSALPSNQSYRPIVSTTLAVDYWLGNGVRPFWFHVSNFATFLAGAFLLGLLVHRLLDGRHPWLALLAAAAYGLLPGNADTVNYIIARSDLLSTLGVIAGFAIYALWPRLRPWQLYLMPVALGMLAKPVAAIFAPLFALYVLCFGIRRPVWRYLAEILPAFLVCGAMTLFIQKMTPHSWVAGSAESGPYLATQPYVALLYFQTFFQPRGLSADYDLTPLAHAGDPRLWAGAAFGMVLLAGGIVAAAFRRTRVIGFGLLWFFIALLPTALFPLAEVINDHRASLAYMGLVIALAGAVALLPAWGIRLAAAAAVCALAIAGTATWRRNEVWKNDLTLWQDAVLKGPGNGRARMNYGAALMGQGKLQQALAQFQQAKIATPFYPVLYVNLAIDEAALGRQAQASHDFQTALQLGPAIPDSHTYYARWLLEQGRRDEAAAQAREALKLSPADFGAQILLARIQAAPSSLSPEMLLSQSLAEFRAGHYLQSIGAAQRALQMRPGYAEAYNNIGASWNSLGRYDLGAAACQQALRLNPQFTLARNNLAYALQMAAAARKK